MLERIDRIDQNLIINGLVKPYAQRMPSGQATLTNSYMYQVIDRFMAKYSGNFNSAPTWEKDGDYSKMVGDFSDATGELHLQQRIESILSAGAAGKKVSFSMEYLSESCDKITVSFYYPNSVDDWASETLISSHEFIGTSTNSLETLKLENIDIGYEVIAGLMVRVVFHDPSALGSEASHKIRKMKLNIGEKAQEWSPCGRNLIEEIALCQRYYEKSYDLDVKPGTITTIGCVRIDTNNLTAVSCRVNIFFTTQKRFSSVIGLWNPISGNYGYWEKNGDYTPVIDHTSESMAHVHLNNSDNAGVLGHWVVDAEL